MNKKDLDRLAAIERRVAEIAKERGLITTDIDFEVVVAQRMIEAMAYGFPVNFSHWSFGRDYEKLRTIYEHTGEGLPYEVVWNFDRPRAFLIETNPLPLNALVIAHVFGHVDFFLGNCWLQRGRSFSDVAEQARRAAVRFREYEAKFGKEEVEATIDAGMSIQWQQHLDISLDEELDNEAARERLIAIEQAKLERDRSLGSEFRNPLTAEEIKEIEKRLRALARKEPPEPIYDLLGYVIRYSPSLKSWQRDALQVIWSQARSLAPNIRTKILDEGWATYWHVQIMRQLFEEGLLTEEEHGVYNSFHSSVTHEDRLRFNWYMIGPAFFEYVKEMWDRGCFGREYEDCEDPIRKAYWDTKAMRGDEKIFEIRSCYTDRMAVENLFSDDFIHRLRLYFYKAVANDPKGTVDYTIVESNPETIRMTLKRSLVSYGIQSVMVLDSDCDNRRELYLQHKYYGDELDMRYVQGTLRNIYYLWGRRVYLETVVGGEQVVFVFDHKGLSQKK